MKCVERIWAASQPISHLLDPFEYRGYLLALFFLKALQDVGSTPLSQNVTKPSKVTWAQSEITIPPQAHFSALVRQEGPSEIGLRINDAFQSLTAANPQFFSHWFNHLNFGPHGLLARVDASSDILTNLVRTFLHEDLTLRAWPTNQSTVANLYDALLLRFAHECGGRGTTFYMPIEIAQLVARLCPPSKQATIFDPLCGTGSLLIQLATQYPQQEVCVVGAENNLHTWALCQMRLFLHGQVKANIQFNAPENKEASLLTTQNFDLIVTNPFFASANWNPMLPDKIRYRQSLRGHIPRAKIGFEFVLQLLEKLNPNGKMIALLPLGALSWEDREQRFRQTVLAKQYLEAVVSLPPYLFLGTPNEFALLIFNRAKKMDEVLLLDASGKSEMAKDFTGRRLDQLPLKAIEEIRRLYRRFQSVAPDVAHISLAQISAQNCDLRPSCYLSAPQQGQPPDLLTISQNIKRQRSELTNVREELMDALSQLGLNIFATENSKDALFFLRSDSE